MADRRKVKKRREELPSKATKQEYSIAKYIRGHLPSKKTTLFNHKVDYFIANKAINLLLDSAWAKGTKSQEALFTTRESVVEYLDLMLKHNFFHRARKIPLSTKESSKSSSSSKKKTDDSSDEQQQDSKRKKKTGTPTTAKKSEEKKKTEEKKKRKFKLDMHLDQLFMDGNEVFVWIYEPTPWKAWIVGSLLVLGAILLCLFPLWPQTVRKGVYYLSIAAAGFFVVILALAIIRLVVFCIVWAITMGKHHLWLLPNLTEDVGFVESFWPIYKHEYRGLLPDVEPENEPDLKTADDGSDEKNGEGASAKEKSGERQEEEGERGTDEEVADPSSIKKKRKKKKKSNEEEEEEEEEKNKEADASSATTADDDVKRPRDESPAAEHTDTDRETTEEDEEYDKFEVLNVDDVPDSDSSEFQTKESGS